MAVLLQRIKQQEIVGDIPSGPIDGSNISFMASNHFLPDTLKVFYNGQRLTSGPSNDYVATSPLVNLSFSPVPGDVILFDYLKM